MSSTDRDRIRALNDEVRQELGGGDPELSEPAGTLIGVEELDQARGAEDAPDGQSDQDRRRRRGAAAGAEEPSQLLRHRQFVLSLKKSGAIGPDGSCPSVEPPQATI